MSSRVPEEEARLELNARQKSVARGSLALAMENLALMQKGLASAIRAQRRNA